MLLSNIYLKYLVTIIFYYQVSCIYFYENDNYFDEPTTKETTEQLRKSSFQVPDEKWTTAAVKDIAYYLRNYKYNEWDHRYYRDKPKEHLIGYYDLFPTPILRSLHWKVYKHCDNEFYKCISYLHSVIVNAPFGRKEDIVTFLNESSVHNETLKRSSNFECEQAMLNSRNSSAPFDSHIEKFQWQTTASYFMCWYTMLGIPALSMIGEQCDNFANCLDPAFGQRNHDPRSNDRLPFACAMYSFCPDPCCPLKHIYDLHQCHNCKQNPCYHENIENDSDYKMCTLDKQQNRDLKALVANKWNVSCNCKRKGFVWKSQYGMCVDINECLHIQNKCNNQTEYCFNTIGSYRCLCKLGYELSSDQNKCIRSDFQITFGDSAYSKEITNC